MLRQAVILVGGKGSRLGALTADTPKPMLAVGGRPFLDTLIETLSRHGIEEIVLSCGYRAEVIQQRYEKGDWGAAVRCVVEPEPAGTGGALRHAAHMLDSTFMLLNGDTLFDFNLIDLVTVEMRPGWLGTLALRALPPGGRYGRIGLAGEKVTGFFSAKPTALGPVNGGVYLLSREILAELDGDFCSLEMDVLPKLAASGRLSGRVYDGYFIDIGVPDDFERAQTEVPTRRTRPAVFFDRDGVLNMDVGYAHRPDQITWVEGAREAVKAVNDRGWYAFVVTNQAGVARGLYDEQAVMDLHSWMQRELMAIGAHIDRFEYCPHHPDAVIASYRNVSDRRKPGDGMLRDISEQFPIDRERSFLVGDQAHDVAAADAFGIAGHLFPGGDLRKFLSEGGLLSGAVSEMDKNAR